ncbi:MAG TPA: TPM domain-containing protein [Longimicrobiaceae bacterium]|nr:TPM domain-containing protein [Longimicrobiaceae bacterium]
MPGVRRSASALAFVLLLLLAFATQADGQQRYRRHRAATESTRAKRSSTLPGGYPRARDDYVNDRGDLLLQADRDSIRAVFRRLRRDTGIHATLLTIGSIHDYATPDSTVEAFATHLFNAWGVGDSIRNDGVLMLVARRDRKVRIELGRGYDARYDARMERVIQSSILPYFRDDEYRAGIRAGATSLAEEIARPFPVDTPYTVQPAYALPAGSSTAGVQVAAIAILLTLLVAALVLYAQWRERNGPRDCGHCGKRMERLDEAGDDVYLESGQQMEERLGSVDYDVWKCTGCGGHQIIPYNSWLSGYGSCPGCHRRTLSTRTTTLESPTYDSQGRDEVNRDCRNCGFHDSDVIWTPRRTRPTQTASSSWSSSSSASSSSSSSSSGSSSGFGGGSSSGGGASGSW